MYGKVASWRIGMDEALAEYWCDSKSPERSLARSERFSTLTSPAAPPDE